MAKPEPQEETEPQADGATAVGDPFAIAFFDVEGYTAFTAEHGDEAGLALAHSLLEIAEELVAGARGTVVKRLGDGLMASFPTAPEAVRCALGVQRALQARAELAADAPIAAAKIGVHWGEALRRDGDLYGHDVNLTARIAAQARGGQVLVSEQARQELRGTEESLELKRIGRASGKGLKERPNVYTVRRRGDIPHARPLELGDEGMLLTLLFDAPGDDIEQFLAGTRLAEAAFNGVGAEIIFSGVNVDDAAEPLMCVLVAFPDEDAYRTFDTDPALEGLRSAALGQISMRSMAGYFPLEGLRALFPGSSE